MAFFEFRNVRVAGFSAGVPANIVSNLTEDISENYDNEGFVKTTGVLERRYDETHTTSLKLDEEKVPSCMYRFGNTSSASIPLTIVTQLKGKIEERPTKFICCGFGVGLSWGTVAFATDHIVISDLVECK